MDPKPGTDMSPYACFANNPILSVDPRGDTSWYYNNRTGALLERIDDNNPNRHFEVNAKFYNAARAIYKSEHTSFDVNVKSDVNVANDFSKYIAYMARETELWDLKGATYMTEIFEPSWTLHARSQVGINEDNNSGVIVSRYHSVNREYKAKAASEPWCASFVGYCLSHMGYEAQLDAGAASYSNPKTRHRAGYSGYKVEAYVDPIWGEKVDKPFVGCIAIHKSGAQYHVTFIIAQSANGNTLYGLGGNQGDQVKISPYSKSNFVAFMRPISYTVPESAKTLPIRNYPQTTSTTAGESTR